MISGGVVGLDFLGDGVGEGVHAFNVELLNLFVGAEEIGFALRNRIAEELVGGVDLAAIFFGGRLECVILLAERMSWERCLSLSSETVCWWTQKAPAMTSNAVRTTAGSCSLNFCHMVGMVCLVGRME